MIFCWEYSNGNGAKSTPHFNRLLLFDRNDTSALRLRSVPASSAQAQGKK